MKTISVVRLTLIYALFSIVSFPPSLLAQAEISACPQHIFSPPSLEGGVWRQPEAARCDDNTWNSAVSLSPQAEVSDVLHFEDFQLDIPQEAQIKGIEVVVIRRIQGSGTVKDHTISLIRNGRQVGNNLATAPVWDQEWTAAFYGGKDQLWGSAWSPALLNNPHFGIGIAASQVAGTTEAEIDEVNITVHYALPDAAFPASALSKRVCIPGPY